MLIQVGVSLFLITLLLGMYDDVASYEERLKGINSYENVYISSSIGSDDGIMNTSSVEKLKVVDNMKKLYTFMLDNPEFDAFTFLQYDLSFENITLRGTDTINNAFFISPQFTDFHKLSCVEGRFFTDQDYESVEKEIPIIMGYNYREDYNLNDKLSYDEDVYRIVGFLDKNQHYFDVKLSNGELYSLDNKIVLPIQVNKLDFAFLHMIINKACIFTDDKSDLIEIQEKSNSLGLFTFEFESYKERLDYYKKEGQLVANYLIFIILSIIIFSVITCISNLLAMVDRSMKEYVIHMLCGATINNIIQRIVSQIMIIMILANVAVFIINGFNAISVITFIISILIGVIILFIPIRKIKRAQISTLLRRVD